jgi:hypothetical protein
MCPALCKELPIPALNILLKLLETRVRLITHVNYFNNIYKILVNVMNLQKPKM